MRKVIYLLTVAAMFNIYAEKPAKEKPKAPAAVKPQTATKQKSEVAPKAKSSSDDKEKARLLAMEKTSKKAIVIIKGEKGSGTGFVADFKGKKVIITNLHVIRDNKTPRFFTQSGRKLKPKSLFFSKDRDLAFFELDDKSVTPLQICTNVGELKNSTPLVVYGNSLGASVVTEVRGTLQGTGPRDIETNAGFVPGNSGSPIINMSTGKVIGVATYMTCKKNWTTYGTKFTTRRFGTRIDNITWDDFQKYDRKKYEYDLYLRSKLINSITIAYQTLTYFEKFYGKKPDEFASGLREQIIHLHCRIKDDVLKNIPEFKPVYRSWNRIYLSNESRLESHRRSEEARRNHQSKTKKTYKFSAFNKYKEVETDIHILIDIQTNYYCLKFTIPRLISAGRKLVEKTPFHYEFFKKEGKELLEYDAEFSKRYNNMIKNLTIIYNAKK